MNREDDLFAVKVAMETLGYLRSVEEDQVVESEDFATGYYVGRMGRHLTAKEQILRSNAMSLVNTYIFLEGQRLSSPQKGMNDHG
jgi:hypothetical protein